MRNGRFIYCYTMAFVRGGYHEQHPETARGRMGKDWQCGDSCIMCRPAHTNENANGEKHIADITLASFADDVIALHGNDVDFWALVWSCRTLSAYWKGWSEQDQE